MLALLKEVVGAIAVAEVVELPRFGCGASAADQILIDQDFDGAKVAGEIARIGIGLGELQRRDFRVMLSCCWS